MNLRLINLVFFIKLVYVFANCICPKINNSNPSKITLNSSYGQEWWYFLHNVIDDTSDIISVENTWIRENNYCNNDNSTYFYQESILWKNGSFTKKLSYINQQDNIGSNFWKINHNSLYFTKINDIYYIYNKLDNLNINMRGYGYPQGRFKDGYVRTGTNTCDTSYTLSFLNLDSSINGYTTISYGEHVYTTSKNQKTPYIGWNCHYSHNLFKNLKFRAYFLCQSKFLDNKKKDPYQRALILWDNNETSWITKFKVYKLQNWKDKNNITYPISWNIHIANFSHFLIANSPLQELISIDNFYFWDGSAILIDENQGFLGVGFNEVLKTI